MMLANRVNDAEFALESRDTHISVDGLMAAILPAMLPSRTVDAIAAGRRGLVPFDEDAAASLD